MIAVGEPVPWGRGYPWAGGPPLQKKPADGEMTQQLKADTVLPEDLSSTSGGHIRQLATASLQSEPTPLASVGTHSQVHTHIKNNKNKSLKMLKTKRQAE